MLSGCHQVPVIVSQLVGDQRHKRQYPEGPPHQMNDIWKAAVRLRLAELGKNQTWLANEVASAARSSYNSWTTRRMPSSSPASICTVDGNRV